MSKASRRSKGILKSGITTRPNCVEDFIELGQGKIYLVVMSKEDGLINWFVSPMWGDKCSRADTHTETMGAKKKEVCNIFAKKNRQLILDFIIYC
jgi:hypothetical protein